MSATAKPPTVRTALELFARVEHASWLTVRRGAVNAARLIDRFVVRRHS